MSKRLQCCRLTLDTRDFSNWGKNDAPTRYFYPSSMRLPSLTFLDEGTF